MRGGRRGEGLGGVGRDHDRKYSCKLFPLGFRITWLWQTEQNVRVQFCTHIALPVKDTWYAQQYNRDMTMCIWSMCLRFPMPLIFLCPVQCVPERCFPILGGVTLCRDRLGYDCRGRRLGNVYLMRSMSRIRWVNLRFPRVARGAPGETSSCQVSASPCCDSGSGWYVLGSQIQWIEDPSKKCSGTVYHVIDSM
jgi:hypothetical protein